MKRLKLLILAFCLAVSFPMAYVSWRTYAGLEQEEKAQLTYFSEALFDKMEMVLSDLIQQEENRSVEEYHHTLAQGKTEAILSPLSQIPEQTYILGYFQNNPDGSFQTPLLSDLGQVPENLRVLVDRITEVNRVFNQKKFSIPSSIPPAEIYTEAPAVVKEKESLRGLKDRYLSQTGQKEPKSYLGKQEVRTQEITAQQALNLSREKTSDQILQYNAGESEVEGDAWHRQGAMMEEMPAKTVPGTAMDGDFSIIVDEDKRFQVEIAPFQSVFISKEYVFIFRRVGINNQIFRQGFIIDIPAFFNDLSKTQFQNQPLSNFMRLGMQVMNSGSDNRIVYAGPSLDAIRFSTKRRFPAPFDFFIAILQTDTIPRSAARQPLNAALIILGVVMILGFLSIYSSVRTVVDLSERRSQFVSTVTHELKTPLTNIRMYIEMLAQGIAGTPEREESYLQVLDAESARLTYLINNVLELARLEKKQRRFQYQPGDLTDVISEVTLVMGQKLKQEGFSLTIDIEQELVFSYDREVLVQLMVNLIENSIKFGRRASERHITISAVSQDDHILIAVSDTGPGIPRKALKKIFNDFYRVDNELTRTTGGTGIGLALVKKFVETMGGQVRAMNNAGPGCTVTLRLPRHSRL